VDARFPPPPLPDGWGAGAEDEAESETVGVGEGVGVGPGVPDTLAILRTSSSLSLPRTGSSGSLKRVSALARTVFPAFSFGNRHFMTKVRLSPGANPASHSQIQW
jgi:hypothetical protein